MTELELVLPRRVPPQPSPAIVPGGDCGACCLAAVTGLSVREVYALRGRDPEALTWWDTRRALEEALGRGLLADLVTTVPIWIDTPPECLTWGLHALTQAHGWLDYLRLALGAGFYALTSVDSRGRGRLGETDHQVVLCGMRRRLEPAAGGWSCREEVLVSCSATGERWADARELLERNGAFALLLARPTPPETP